MSTTTPQSSVAAPKTMFTTAQAAHVILGGTDTDAYWGFTFDEFVAKLQAAMVKHIGNPADAPWRKHLDYTASDYLELQQLLEGMDFVKDPADRMDMPMASAFARRCDIVGMHGGVNGIGVGKDTVANALKPHGFVAMSFADTLKASLSMAYGVPLRYVTERSLKEAPLPGTQSTPRRLMQLWGTEVGRSITPTLWLKRHQLRVASAMFDLSAIAKSHPERISGTNGIRVSVPDVRFPDEGAYVRDLGGFVAWISRPSLASVAATLSNGHVSEAGIPRHPTDMELVNEGPMAEFQATATRAVLSRFTPAEAATARRIARP
jgi:hypothetical protein